MNREYLETARLLIQIAPLVFVDDQFGFKGGSAINLFLRDMPRLSVDLDLVFTDHTVGREDALARINAAVRETAIRSHNDDLGSRNWPRTELNAS
jgi:predicted nucleotidyltransferase component of viral defense system